ncbi:hypothetical protein D9M71_677600 [compost metagenome]
MAVAAWQPPAAMNREGSTRCICAPSITTCAISSRGSQAMTSQPSRKSRAMAQGLWQCWLSGQPHRDRHANSQNRCSRPAGRPHPGQYSQGRSEGLQQGRLHWWAHRADLHTGQVQRPDDLLLLRQQGKAVHQCAGAHLCQLQPGRSEAAPRPRRP